MRGFRSLISSIDQSFLAATLILVGVGLVMIFSASAQMAHLRYGTPYLFVKKQMLWILLSFLACFVMAQVDYRKLSGWVFPLLVVTFAGLIAVFVFGHSIGGAKRWLRVGGFGFQPSELAKLTAILFTARYLDRHHSRLKFFWRGYFPLCLVLGSMMLLVVAEPDLGTTILIATIGAGLMFLGGVRWSHMISTFLAALPALYVLLLQVPYRRKRLMVFLHPWSDPQGAGFQITQSLIAIGSGGIFGKGLGSSNLDRIMVPESHTDFIFPIIAEELGFVGVSVLLILFGYWAYRACLIMKRVPDDFGKYVAAGITMWIFFQAVFNIGVAVSLLPAKGLPLPFVSFGGSSMLITMAAVGIMLNLSKARAAKS